MFASSKNLLAVAVFTILLILAVNLAWWLFYDRTEQMLDQQLSRRLAAVATTTTLALNPTEIDNLILGDLNVWLNINELLTEALNLDSLSEIFILDDNYAYLATTSTSSDSIYFMAELNSVYIDSLFYNQSARPIVTASYQTGSIILKTAFVPLFDELGSVIAVLGVEASVDYFDALVDLKQNLYLSSSVSLLGGIIFGFLFILVQRRLNKAQQQMFMNETHAYLGRMVAVVAHEIKNPLMIIRASAERMAKKHKAQESDFVIEEVDRLNQIVSGYLDFAKGGGSALGDEQPSEIDLRELCASIRHHFQDKYPDNKIQWLPEDDHTDSRETKKLVYQCHPRSLRQVILNLLINSADACLSASLPIKIGLTASEQNNSFCITVSDKGTGMTKRELSHAFDPFFTPKQTGPGLGLYLSQKILAEMAGRMDIISKPGDGTQVIIRLPKTPSR